MNRIFQILILCFTLGLIVFSCAKDEVIENDVVTTIPDSQEIVNGTVYGRVMNEDGTPLSGVTVNVMTGIQPQSIQTDSEGYFLFRNLDNKGKSTFLQFDSPGKFRAFRRYSIIADRFNYTEVKMMDKQIIGSVSSEAGGELNHPSGARIDLPSEGIIDENGAIYTGDVNVAMAWVDPSAQDLAARMIGDLSGIDEKGSRRALSTYGMLQIELLSDSGSELNLGENQFAELRFPVPSDMVNNAPESIPLWSYNEIKGTWIQEGQAELVGSEYVGLVSHFSSWNVDFMQDPIEISGLVEWNIQGDTVGGAYLQVYVCSDRIGRKGGWLCDAGEFLFYNFPKNEEFELKIFDHCGNKIFSESYGPYQENTDLGTIQVVSSSAVVLVEGNALDCDGIPILNGLVNVVTTSGVQTFPIDDNGEFEFSVDLCAGGSATMKIIDIKNLLEFETTIDDTQSIWRFPNTTVCDNLEEYLLINIDGNETIYTDRLEFWIAKDSLNQIDISTIRHISVGGNEANFTIQFLSPMSVPSTATTFFFSFWLGQGEFYYLNDVADMNIEIQEHDSNSGGIIRGTYSGTVINEFDNSDHLISGEFLILVD